MKTYTAIQIVIGVFLISVARSDIQFIPGLMIILNAINFYLIKK